MVKHSDCPGSLFSCRCCSRSCMGSDFSSRGWKEISNIDGPNAVCPSCQADPESLDGLKRDGYENARIVEDGGESVHLHDMGHTRCWLNNSAEKQLRLTRWEEDCTCPGCRAQLKETEDWFETTCFLG